MYQVKCLNKISPLGTSRLGENYHVGEDEENPDAILVRSAAMHDTEFNKNLLAIARAGAGTNNIPVDRCVQEGIVVFNTPGANANAVKELVIAALLLTSRKIVPGIEWAGTLKGKGDEVGKLVEKANPLSLVLKLRAKPLVLSALELLVFLLQTQQKLWA